MKKKTLLASIVLASAALSLAACGQPNPTSAPTSTPTSAPTSAPTSTPTSAPTSAPTSTPTSAPTSTPTSAPTSAPTSTPTSTPTSAPTSTPTTDPVKETVTITAHYNPGDATYDKTIEVDLVEDVLTGTKFATFTEAPTDDYRNFLGWYEDAEFTTELRTAITDDIEVFAKWESKGTVDKVFRFDATKLTDGVGLTGSIYNFVSADQGGTRNKATINALGEAVSGNQPVVKNGKLEVKAPADGTLYMVLENGSGSSASQYSVTSSDGTYTDFGVCDFVGSSDAYTAKRFPIELKKDVTYTFTKTNGTIYVYDLYMKCAVELSPVSGITLTSNGVVDYIEGQQYDGSNVNVDLVYENKSTEAADMSKVSIDTSTLDMTKPGVQKVTVKYPVTQTLYGTTSTTDLTQELEINVYSLESLKLGFNSVSKGAQTVLGGNGTYVNNTVKVVYGAGEAYSSAYLTVFAECLLNTENKEFTLASSAYTIDDATSFTGSEVKRTITVTYTTNGKTKTVSYDVYVVTTAPSVVEGVVQVAVDQKYNGTVGAVVDGFNTFTSIQQALDYLEAYSTSIEGKDITLKIGEGTYKEKLEFTIPNMTVVGAGKDKTIIEWDSLYGLKDEGGFIHTTDSTQTVAVRESAENFTISGVTISNYWNDRTKYIESGMYGATDGKNASEHRALAILIQADKFIMDDCNILGMQDTIELFAGRQLIKNTYICGTTDFIFGSNNTTLFQGCTIEVKASEDNKTGGYITAFKGCSKGAEDAVSVGVIFNECTFKAEAGVPDESVAIARPWGIYSFVGVMNSELGKCIAKGTTVDTQKNQYTAVDTTVVTAPVAGTTYYVADGNNYVVANVTEWAAETVYYTRTATASRYYNGLTKNAFDLNIEHLPTVTFFEYNNTGAGAMTDEELAKIVATYNNGTEDVSVRLVYTLTNELAELFIDQQMIFAKESHPNVKYQDNWSGDIATDVTVNFYVADELYTTVNECSGNTLILPDDPTVEGYLFEGWYVDSLYQTKYNLDSVLEAGTLNLYANFIVATSQTDTYSLDLTAITATKDKEALTATTFGTKNSFLTIVDSSKVTARVKDAATYCIENKDGNLKVTFKGTGTLTISYCSTSGSNKSRIRLVNENGQYVSATTVDSAFTYVEAENAYEITGSTAKDITFTITSAGTYTIDCVSTTTGRGGRIYAVSMSDTYSVASGSGDAGVMPLSLLKKEDEE